MHCKVVVKKKFFKKFEVGSKVKYQAIYGKKIAEMTARDKK